MRKFVITLVMAGVLAVFTACAGGPDLPPKAGPEEVQLILPMAGQSAEEGYETIGPVIIRVPLGTANEEIYRLLRTEAARMGADAIIFQGTERTDTNATSGRTDIEMIATALAIYYPTPEMMMEGEGGEGEGDR